MCLSLPGAMVKGTGHEAQPLSYTFTQHLWVPDYIYIDSKRNGRRHHHHQHQHQQQKRQLKNIEKNCFTQDYCTVLQCIMCKIPLKIIYKRKHNTACAKGLGTTKARGTRYKVPQIRCLCILTQDSNIFFVFVLP